jgi:hypothetical protein
MPGDGTLTATVVIRLAGWFRQVEQPGREDLFSTPPDKCGPDSCEAAGKQDSPRSGERLTVITLREFHGSCSLKAADEPHVRWSAHRFCC